MNKFLLALTAALCSLTSYAQPIEVPPDSATKQQMDKERAEFEEALRRKYAPVVTSTPVSENTDHLKENPHALILSFGVNTDGNLTMGGPGYAYTFSKYFELGGDLSFSWTVVTERTGLKRAVTRQASGSIGIVPTAFIPVGEKLSLMFSIEPALIVVQDRNEPNSTSLKFGFGMEFRVAGLIYRMKDLELASGIDYAFGRVNNLSLYNLDALSGNVDLRFRF